MSYKTLVVDQSWSADLLGMVENPTQGKKNCKIYIICFLKRCLHLVLNDRPATQLIAD